MPEQREIKRVLIHAEFRSGAPDMGIPPSEVEVFAGEGCLMIVETLKNPFGETFKANLTEVSKEAVDAIKAKG